MRRSYAFMVRIHLLEGGAARVEVEHIQSGEKVHVTSLAAGIAWIGARCNDASARQDKPDNASDDATGPM